MQSIVGASAVKRDGPIPTADRQVCGRRRVGLRGEGGFVNCITADPKFTNYTLPNDDLQRSAATHSSLPPIPSSPELFFARRPALH